ncbi:MAG: hypothetical protein QM778_25150 [Myxococcales bacterium]
MLAGPHQVANQLWLSKDGGMTFTDIGKKLPVAPNFSTLPLVIDSMTFLVGSCGPAMGACGVLRSDNAGESWTRTATQVPVGRPLWANDGRFYWGLADGGMIVSNDRGVTWRTAGEGPAPLSYGSSPVELPDGRVVTLGADSLLASSDKGKTWKKLGQALPYAAEKCGINGLTYSVGAKAFFINHNDCSGNLPSDAVFSMAYDYRKP